jgi:hypothetical protein
VAHGCTNPATKRDLCGNCYQRAWSYHKSRGVWPLWVLQAWGQPLPAYERPTPCGGRVGPDDTYFADALRAALRRCAAWEEEVNG